MDVYDESGKRWAIFEYIQGGKTRYRVPSGFAVHTFSDGSFPIPFGKPIIARPRLSDGGQ